MQEIEREKSPIKGRILQYLENKGISKYAFYKETGISRGILDQETGISEDNLARFIQFARDISLTWLINGDGAIFNTKSTENVVKENDHINDHKNDHKRKVQKTWSNEDYSKSILNRNRFGNISDVEGGYEAPILLEQPGVGVPYYDVDFCAGFDLVFNDQTAIPAGYVNIPQYRNADSLANITGHSMEPLISNGDIIALKRLEDWHTYLLYGEIYGIMTDEYRTVKRVRKGRDKEHIILEPINKSDFEETEIPKSIITGVWMVLGCVKKLF